MDYEELLNKVQNTSKQDIKKLIFDIDQDSMKKVADMDIDDKTKKLVYDILKNRTYLDMLLVNALMK